MTTTRDTFPVVGIGSSAGGLEALQDLFRHLPADTGMAFVVVTHQHPGHESVLPELLARETAMAVTAIEDGMRVEPDRVYVLGAGKNVTIEGGILRLQRQTRGRMEDMPIDHFFRSLAADMHERAIAVVLSGTGTDGTQGIREIKAHGGMVVVQIPPSARYSGMPTSARNTGVADFVEPPGTIPECLANYMKGPYLRPDEELAEEAHFPIRDLEGILRFIRSRTGHDFSWYKRSTLRRRIERRMSVHGLGRAGDYLDFLHDNPHEARQLFGELLISVTSFFRDPEAFEMLKEKYLPELIRSRPDGHEFRVWIPGCATGEEAYSVAIIVDEVKRKLDKTLTARIFGTDIDELAIRRARHGVYPEGIAVDVSPQRLARYFTREGADAYVVRKEIRDSMVFASHNLFGDPPFMRQDLLVCRNLVIYLLPELQQRLIPFFHYALAQDGLLFLGASESVGDRGDLFESLDRRWRIFRRINVRAEIPQLPGRPTTARKETSAEATRPVRPGEPVRLDRQIERFLLGQFAPICIVVDDKGTIRYIHGRTGAYLEPEQQNPRNNLLEMAREGLCPQLAAAFHQAMGLNMRIERSRVRVRTDGTHQLIDLSVAPIRDPEALRGLYLVTITPSSPPRRPERHVETERMLERETVPPSEREQKLERELRESRESNRIMTEELQSRNQELQGANEELQTTNEEIQSGREEMDSLNEQLATLNSELEGKVRALGQARDDTNDLLNSSDIAMIFMDRELRVRRYTERAARLICLREFDIGRPVTDLASRVLYEPLFDDCREVLDTLQRKEVEVATCEGTWQLLRIVPFRTSGNVIAGVVLIFVDITALKEEARWPAGWPEQLHDVYDTVREPLLLLDERLRVQHANPAFLQTFRVGAEETEGRLIFELGDGRWDIPRLRELLERILPENESITDFVVEHDFPTIGHKVFVMNARRLRRQEGAEGMVLVAMQEAG